MSISDNFEEEWLFPKTISLQLYGQEKFFGTL